MSSTVHPKKVLIILQSLCAGGAEIQTIYLANNLDKNKFQIYLFYLDNKNDLLHKIDRSNVNHIECLNRKGKIDIRIVQVLTKFIIDHNIDIVYCINEYPLLYAFLAKQLFKLRHRFMHQKKFVVSIHYITLFKKPWEIIKNTIYRHMINKCDRVIFVSKKQMNAWITNCRINRQISEQIYNAVDCNYFRPETNARLLKKIRTDFKIESSDFVVGICSILRKEKNHKDFIWAIWQCHLKGYPIKGLVIGDGPERATIEKYIASFGMDDHIKITGFHSDVRPFISCCNCLVNTSSSVEGHSLAALEAMAMSKTMVMSNIGGASETIEDGYTGFLYDVSERHRLVEILCKLIDHPEMNIKAGQLARKRTQKRFALPQMIKAYGESFDSLYR